MSVTADETRARPAATTTARLASLDVFRGLTIAGMIADLRLVDWSNGPEKPDRLTGRPGTSAGLSSPVR